MLDAFLRTPNATIAKELDVDALMRAFAVAIVKLYDSAGKDVTAVKMRRLILRELKERTGD